MLLITAVCGYAHYFEPSLNFLCYALIATAVGTAFVASGVYFIRGGPCGGLSRHFRFEMLAAD